MPEICLLHFNDVKSLESASSTAHNYNNKNSRRAIEETERARDVITGVASRFSALVKSFNAPLLLFSGNAFNPSKLSTITQGLHMAPILNQLSTAVGILGNVSKGFHLDTTLLR